MARGQPFGEETYRPEVSPEAEPRKMVPEERAAPLAPAVEAFAGAVQQKFVADSGAYAGDQLTNLRVGSIDALRDAKAAVPAGDPGNFAGDYMANFDKQAQAYLDKAHENPVAHSMMQRGIGQLRASIYEDAVSWEAAQRVAYQKDSLRTNLERQLPAVRAHPEMSDQVGQSLVDQANTSRLAPDEKLEYMRYMHNNLTRTAALGLVDQNPAQVYRQLLGEQDPTKMDPRIAELDPQSRAEVLAAARSGVVDNFAAGALEKFRAGGPDAGAKAIAAVKDLNLPGPQGEQDLMRESIRSEIEKRRAGLIAEQKQTYGRTIISVEEQLRSKDPATWTRGAIWGLYRNNALDAHTTGAYLGELDAAEQRKADAEVDLKTIQSAWDGKTFLDPKMDKSGKEAVSTWFENFTTANKAPVGSPAWVNIGAEFARRTGVVPEPIGEWARQVLVASQDPGQVMSAVDAIQRVRAASPRGFPYFDDDKRLAAMSDMVTRLSRNGIPPLEAIKMARETAARGDEEKERMGELWKQARPFGPADSALEATLRKAIADDPNLTTPGAIYGRNVPKVIPPELQADYARGVRALFDYNGGHADWAESDMADRIGKAWGITTVNGEPELTRWPVERIFPGLTVEDVRNDISQVVADHADNFQRWNDETHKLEPFKVDPDKVLLVPMRGVTEQSGGRRWGLMYEASEEGGDPQVIYGKNQQPLQYEVPVRKEDFEAVRTRERAASDERRRAEKAERERTEHDALERLKLDAASPWAR